MKPENDEYVFLDMTDPNTLEQVELYKKQSDPIHRPGKTTIIYEDDDTLDIFYHEPDIINSNKPSCQIQRILPSNFPHRNKTSPPANDTVQKIILAQNHNINWNNNAELEIMEIANDMNIKKPKKSCAFALLPASSSELNSSGNGRPKRAVTPNKSQKKTAVKIAPKKRKMDCKVAPKNRIQNETNQAEKNNVKNHIKASQNICNSNSQSPSRNSKSMVKVSPKQPEIMVTRAQPKKKRSKNGTFICETCDCHFQYASTLKNHFAKVHKEAQRSLSVPSFRCHFCPCQFGSDMNRTKHVVQFHLYECEFCGITFGQAGYLEAHRTRRHDLGQPRFYCEECDINFSSSELFLDHNRTRVHQHKTSFLCPAKGCGRTFNSDEERAEHCTTFHGHGQYQLERLTPARFEIQTLMKSVGKVGETKTSSVLPSTEVMPSKSCVSDKAQAMNSNNAEGIVKTEEPASCQIQIRIPSVKGKRSRSLSVKKNFDS